MTTSATDLAGVSSEPMGSRKLGRRYIHCLRQPGILEEMGPPGVLRLLLLTIALLVVAAIGLAATTKVMQTTHAPGAIIPAGAVLRLQHLEGGIVAEILVQDGELVEEDAVLIRLDPASASADLEERGSMMASLELEVERLRAFIESRAADFSRVDNKFRHLVAQQQEILTAQEVARTSQRTVAINQIDQREAEILILEAQSATLQQREKIMHEVLAMREELAEKGLVSKIQYLNTKHEHLNAERELAKNISDIARARQALEEARSRLVQLDSQLANEAAQRLGRAVAELEQLRESAVKAQDRVERLEVRAPQRGIIKDLKVNTKGGVITPGAVIAELVPVDRELLVEARLPPADRGRLAVGQSVEVKLQSYDFTRFGSIPGRLEQISATTFVTPTGEVYYKGNVRLQRDYVGETRESGMVMPGMLVEASVHTGERTVLHYLLRPVYQALNRAFQEG